MCIRDRFYHMRDENGVPQGYDLIWRGVEITTGAQREHRYEVLKKQAEEKGLALSLIHIFGSQVALLGLIDLVAELFFQTLVQVSQLDHRERSGAVSYTHLDVYKRQVQRCH